MALIVRGSPLWNYHSPGAKDNEVACRIWVLCAPDTGCVLGQSSHKMSEVRPSPRGSSLQRCSLITPLSVILSPRPVQIRNQSRAATRRCLWQASKLGEVHRRTGHEDPDVAVEV